MSAQRLSRSLTSPKTMRLLGAGLLAGLAGLVLLLLFVPAPSPRRLLDVAHRVALTKNWQGGVAGYPGYEPYFLLSDHEFVFFGGSRGAGHHPVLRNVAAERNQPLAVSFRAHFGFRAQLNGMTLSPDRRWLLWVDDNFHCNVHHHLCSRIVAASLDGKARRVWPHLDGWVWHPTWLPDSRGWFAWSSSDAGMRVLLARRDEPQTVAGAAMTIPDAQKVAFPLAFLPSGRVLGIDQARMKKAGILNHAEPNVGSVKMSFLASGPKPIVEMVAFDPAAPTTILGRYRAAVPLGARIATVALSPDGRRLAWIVEASDDPQLVSRLRDRLSRLLPALVPPPASPSRASLWTSRLDGSDAREIGDTPRTLGRRGAFAGSVPSAPQWTPDGKRIGFLHEDALWIVAADK